MSAGKATVCTCIRKLRDVIASANTSKWLDGGRYGHIIFRNTRTGRLSQAPARVIPAFCSLDRRGRCSVCAKNLREFTEETALVEA